jgi:putative redox protein
MYATAKPVDGSLRTEIDVNGRHTITTDEPERLGGTNTAPAPHELLPAILASCASTMVMLYAQRREWELDGLEVRVLYDPEVTPRRVEIDLRLPAGLSDEQVSRLQRVADTCPVKRALEAGFDFDEASPPAPAPDPVPSQPRAEEAHRVRRSAGARRRKPVRTARTRSGR